MDKLKILVFIQHYLPGYKWGGPTRTLANMVEHLGDEFDFKIITMNRDFGDSQAFTGIKSDQWIRVGKAEIYYISPENLILSKIRDLLYHSEYDILYLNSFFNFQFTIKPLWLKKYGLLPFKPTIIAPRGEFSSGALSIKRFKKSIYIKLVKILKFYHNLIWQASSKYERADILKNFSDFNNIIIAPDLPPVFKSLPLHRSHNKLKNCLKILFLSRISPMKNLHGALELLSYIDDEVKFSIYGTKENNKYWQKCQNLIDQLPGNIQVEFKGSIAPENIPELMTKFDVFLLPTFGENYGHVILEALACGLPVVISDRTPWRDLIKYKAGWDMPLEDNKKYINVLKKLIIMDESEHSGYRQGAQSYAQSIMENKVTVKQNSDLFYSAYSRYHH